MTTNYLIRVLYAYKLFYSISPLGNHHGGQGLQKGGFLSLTKLAQELLFGRSKIFVVLSILKSKPLAPWQGLNMRNHNPVERFFALPPSRKRAIEAMCASCMGCAKDHLEEGFKSEIRNCSAQHCSLHAHRPYQGIEESQHINDRRKAEKTMIRSCSLEGVLIGQS